MKRSLLILLCIGIITTAFSQNVGLINKKKSAIRQLFVSNAKPRNLQATINETDSSLSFILTDTVSTFHHINVFTFFDSYDRCNKQEIWTDCDSCCKRYIHAIAHRWTKINDSTYLSKHYILTDTRKANPYSFVLMRSPYDKASYKSLKAGKK
jgi:hypothetical protein